MKKVTALILAVCMTVLFSSCSGILPGNKAYTVTDSRGTAVSFDKVPAKVISLLPSDTEILYALGLGDKIIADSTYCNYPEDANNKTKLDSGAQMNIESIIGMNPDVVILGQMAQTEDQFKQLEDAGVKVVVTEASSIDTTYTVMEMLGQVFGKEDKAAQLIDGMKKDFEEIKNEVAGKTPKKVYMEISPLKYGLWTSGKGTFNDELLTLVGAQNIFSDVSSWSAVSEEQVLSRNPEVIITTTMAESEADDPVKEILGRANWDKVDAVKNGSVYTTNSDAIQRPGPRLVDAARDLVKIIYGE